MRNLLTYLVLFGLSLNQSVMAQELDARLPMNSGESIVLLSDRYIYGAGEEIHFFASYEGPAAAKEGSWSTVLYVELLSWDGSKQASSKVQIRQGLAQGSMSISANIASGVYYLRAYTLWMRNYSPLTYAYLPLTVLNPYVQDVLAGPVEGSEALLGMEENIKPEGNFAVLSGLQEHYGTREPVELDVEVLDGLSTGPYSLSIAKTGSRSSSDFSWKETRTVSDSGSIEFLPEIYGLSLSGRVIDRESGEGVDRASLQLSSYAQAFLFAEVLSRQDGSFLYVFPRFTGTPELHIAEAPDHAGSHQILLASEFCNKPVTLPYVPLQIDSSTQAIVQELLINCQLKERYSSNTSDEPLNTIPSSFYGHGASVTNVKDYIELADLRELVYEIIPQVSIRSTDGVPGIIIQGQDCMDIYPPLVLLDNVPVPNNEELLNIPGNRIERIEVLNRAYMVGNTRYSGIFSIYSSNKDMAGLSTRGEGHFFNLQMLDQYAKPEPALHSSDAGGPFIRNLLYWEPDIRFSEGGRYKLRFSAPDTPGTYVLSLRGGEQEKDHILLFQTELLVK